MLKQLKKLDVNKATGLDNISARLLKAGAVPLSTPLTHIFNVSLRTGIVPIKMEKKQGHTIVQGWSADSSR